MMTLGKRPLVSIAAVLALMGGVSACSSSASTPASSSSEVSGSAPAPVASSSAASGIPADVAAAYFKATCTAPSTYDDAVQSCTDEKGEPQTLSQFTVALEMTPVRVTFPAIAYAIFPPEKFPACPSKADIDAYVNDAGTTLQPPTVTDECLTSVMVLMTTAAGTASSN